MGRQARAPGQADTEVARDVHGQVGLAIAPGRGDLGGALAGSRPDILLEAVRRVVRVEDHSLWADDLQDHHGTGVWPRRLRHRGLISGGGG
jgi:hypothetical protein